ncbi:Uma2 family endonuclease [Gloeocapsa sp. PCC 73106]|uniref:Uma2 family endonuclease n=1 Tax=Gloeocapsa sp. PCC 73106 TaxID=102232 RepID=UPI0002ACC56A|nr:Uma2 family endonuclease [Gloeocapsa sp. PCC 73106]ELR98838.1 hypothetical protein GLO73106DRAFT_00026760 [Gloeocapsa sp. PCC 73106]
MLTKIDLSSITSTVSSNFELICRRNPELKLELTAMGELMIMSPMGGSTGRQNARLIISLGIWNESKTPEWGVVFDSSTCFRLPNGSLRSPDVAWISLSRWNELTREQQDQFPPIVPDFVMELLSKSDNLKTIQEKMEEYQSVGVRLGWLLNPSRQEVEIYRLGETKEVLVNPSILSGEDVLPGLAINLSKIWL